MHYEQVKRGRYMVIGIQATTSNAQEMSGKGVISSIWNRFWAENVPAKVLEGKAVQYAYGVYTAYETDYKGPYSFMAGIVVPKGTVVPQGMVAVELGQGTYLKFTGKGELPAVVIQVWQDIWNFFSRRSDWIRSYTTDFEVYNLEDKGSIEIYIAVKNK